VFASKTVLESLQTWERNILGKQFATFAPMGPVLATRDEITDPANVRLTTRLNGEVMQDANTCDLVLPLATLIAYYSQYYHFMPGDIITTGSPSGVGYGRNPKRFMSSGDVIEVIVEGIGTLSNPVLRAHSDKVQGAF
jgi:2-keto-4-pentenoate hydratase/2-oxohepta-3-ene-1,7-dioic acid hydratase in catechol pathway